MSKSRKANKYYDDYNEDEFNDGMSYEEYREKKKNKKLSRALRTMNVEELINLDEDEY
jgi:hypothetical protein